jgi:hypothetical protein
MSSLRFTMGFMHPPSQIPPKPTPRLSPTLTGFLYAGLGLLCVPLIQSTCLTRTMGWLLQSIIHEGGHTLMALALGRFALPRISLDGHVPYTMVNDHQMLWLCAFVYLVILFLTFESFKSKFLRKTTAFIAILYPFLALSTRNSQLAILLAGHGAELLFAGICLWRAQTGLFTHNQLERAAYSIVGWYLVFANFLMCLGILRDPATRDQYINGSDPAIINDYVVASYDTLILTSIQPVVIAMLIASIAVYPITLLYARGVHHSPTPSNRTPDPKP